MPDLIPDPQQLLDLVRARMPFGRFQGRRLVELPEAYLVWFSRKGFPRGKLGAQLETLYEIRRNGLGHILAPLVEAERRRERHEG